MFGIRRVEADVLVRVPRPASMAPYRLVNGTVTVEGERIMVEFEDTPTALDLLRRGRFLELDYLDLKLVSANDDKEPDV